MSKSEWRECEHLFDLLILETMLRNFPATLANLRTRTRLKFLERIHTPEGLPIMILHNARSGSRFKWYLIDLINISWWVLSRVDSLLFSNIAEVLYFRGWQDDDSPILLTYCWKRETGGVFANIPTCWPTPRVCWEYVKKERNPFFPFLKWSFMRLFSSFFGRELGVSLVEEP